MSEALKNAITIERKENGKWMYTIEFTAPAEAVDKEFEAALKAARKHAQLPGFRVGKAPAEMVKARYGALIAEDVERAVKSAAFEKMGDDEVIDIILYGRPESVLPVEKADYKFTLEVEVAPEFDTPDYKNMKVEGDAGDDVETRCNARIDYMKNMYADFTKLEEGEVMADDMVKVSFESDFTPAEDASDAVKRAASSESSWVWISEPEQYPGLIAALTGAKIGDTVTFDAVYPEDWREEGLRSKTVKYTFKINEVQRKTPITDNEELAKKAGAESFEAFKTQLMEAAEREREYAKAESARAKLLEQLLAAVPDMEFPQNTLSSAVQKEFSRIAERNVRNDEELAKFKEEQEKHLEEAKKLALEYLKKFFILRKIARLENISVPQDELDMQINAMAAYMGYKVADVKNMLERRGGTDDLHAEILMTKVLDSIAGNKD